VRGVCVRAWCVRDACVRACMCMCVYKVFHFKWYGWLSPKSMILLKNFSNKSCMAWRRISIDGNVDL